MFDSAKESNDKDPKFNVGDHSRLSKHKKYALIDFQGFSKISVFNLFTISLHSCM